MAYRSALVAALGIATVLQSGLASDQKSGPPASAEEVTLGLHMYGEVLPACSPDGRWLAFEYHTNSAPDYPRVGVTRLGRAAHSWRPLLGGRPSSRLFVGDLSWSPDSRSLALITNSHSGRANSSLDSDNLQVVRVDLSTSKMVKLTDFPSSAHLGPTTAWLRTGLIVFTGPDEDIYGVPERGGKLQKLVKVPLDRCSGGTNTLAVSPDEQRIAFAMDSGRENQITECDAVWISDLRTGRLLRVPTVGLRPLSPFWLDANTLLFSGESSSAGERLPVGIYGVSLGTGKVTRLLEGPYLTPFVCDSGKTLYFSWGTKVRDKMRGDGWSTFNDFYWFHIWKIPLHDVLRRSDSPAW